MASKEEKRKFYWHANTSSGGTLSLSMDFDGDFSKKEKEEALAEGLRACYENMRQNGFIPFNAKIMSSGDLARTYGKTRQYWEKLLNEGKIHYKETSAGRITTNLWVNGYIENKEKVNKYVKDVKEVLRLIDSKTFRSGTISCPVCSKANFQFNVNYNSNTNGICRSCGFYVHTTN
jgi:hypothetical protein